MSQRFVRCAHCGLPHSIDESVCPITGRPIEARRSNKAALGAKPTASPYRPSPSEGPSSAKMAAASERPFETAPPPPLIGQILGGKYRAIRVLGEGGMGSVYECEHLQLHRKVAVKVLHPTQARKKASVARFQNEAHVASAIGHPNICEVYDMGEIEDGSPFLVMELLQGDTLADRIASEGALPFEDIIEIIGQVLSGLIAAHGKGIIHRDIKPENVFLTSRHGLPPMVKILDFGISKVAGADDLHLTRTGMVMGTPFYMSPEQARGDRNLDHRVDIYACGVMMYECLTGRRPFHAANYNALLMQILTTSPRPTTEVRPAVPDAFEAVVAKAMQRDRDKRFQGASDMQREVQLLRDPAGMRRHQSVPPEPVPLVTQRRRDDGMPASRPMPPSRPKPVEFPPVSIDIEGRDLLDSGLLRADELGDSGSLEIPIVAEAPVSAKDIAPPPPSKPMYRPDPAFAAKHPPPPAQAEPRRSIPPPIPKAQLPRAQAPVSQPSPKAPVPQTSIPRAPVPSVGLKPNVPALPKVQPRANVQQPPPIAKTRQRAPTPNALDAPWLDDPHHDADPTEIGSIFSLRESTIDADSTERIPPERIARLQAKRQQPAPADRTERVTTDKFNPERIVEHLIAERVSDDEAPTTLFDRRTLKGKLGRRGNTGGNPAAVPRASTTERSPAPTPSGGRAPSVAPLAPPPLPRFRGPKDG